MKPIDRAFIRSRLFQLHHNFDKRSDTEIAKELGYLAITAEPDALLEYSKDNEIYKRVKGERDAANKPTQESVDKG